MSLNESESHSVKCEPLDPSLTFSCDFGLRAVISATIWDRCCICSTWSGMTSTKSVWNTISDFWVGVAAFSSSYWLVASVLGLAVTVFFLLHWMLASLVCAFGDAHCCLNWECLAACSAWNEFSSWSPNTKSRWKLSSWHQVSCPVLSLSPLDCPKRCKIKTTLLRQFKY